MPPLTKDRNTKRTLIDRTFPAPVAADTIIFQGAQVARNRDGFAVPAADEPGFVVLGRAERQVDNRGGLDGERVIPVARGVFLWDNAPADGIDQLDLGMEAFVVDDHVVGKLAATAEGIVAGIVDQVTEDGIWVATL